MEKIPHEPVRMIDMGGYVQYTFKSGLSGSTAKKKEIEGLKALQKKFGSNLTDPVDPKTGKPPVKEKGE